MPEAFTVKVGTVFEHGRIPLHKMLQAVYLMCASKNGVSAHQIHRTLEITYKTAWFLCHRIREATNSNGCATRPRMQETGSTGSAERIQSSSLTGLYAMANGRTTGAV